MICITLIVGHCETSILYKTVDVDSPWRQENVKRVMRGSYISLTSSVVQSSRTADQVVLQLCRKIKEEIKLISSNEHNSILRDNHEGVKNFSWENIWEELVINVPTLVKIIASLIHDPSEDKPVVCFIVSIILKCRFRCMSLVQRVVSVLLYGHGASKQVIITLHNC